MEVSDPKRARALRAGGGEAAAEAHAGETNPPTIKSALSHFK